jgi:hypothetical protein
MKICQKCGDEFNSRPIIDGKRRNFQRRKYCLTCSPFNVHNTTKLDRHNCTREEYIENRDYYTNLKYKRWQRKARHERKQKLVDFLGGKCSICGYNRCMKALEFHHTNEDTKSEKSFGISSKGMLAPWETLVMEIEKCILVCANCHREIHDNEVVRRIMEE